MYLQEIIKSSRHQIKKCLPFCCRHAVVIMLILDIITGDELRPDLLITLENKCIYILELTVGFESNLLTNATRKRQKYQDLINEQLKNYEKVKFVNLSISSLGVFSHSSLDFTEMLKDLKFDEQCRSTMFGLLTYVSGTRIIYSVSVTKNGITHN